MAATPVRAQQTEAALQGQPWTEATVQQAMRVLQAEFSPISDMRASGDYRRTVLGNLLQRFWLESQGGARPASRNCRRPTWGALPETFHRPHRARHRPARPRTHGHGAIAPTKAPARGGGRCTTSTTCLR